MVVSNRKTVFATDDSSGDVTGVFVDGEASTCIIGKRVCEAFTRVGIGRGDGADDLRSQLKRSVRMGSNCTPFCSDIQFTVHLP